MSLPVWTVDISPFACNLLDSVTLPFSRKHYTLPIIAFSFVFIYWKCLGENAGNGISEPLNLKHFLGSMSPYLPSLQAPLRRSSLSVRTPSKPHATPLSSNMDCLIWWFKWFLQGVLEGYSSGHARRCSGRAWNTANKQPRLGFHVRNRPCTCRQQWCKSDKIIKVMLDFIVSTKKFIFSDLTHWLIDSWLMTHDSLTHLTHKTSVLQNTAYFAFFPDFSHLFSDSDHLFRDPWVPLKFFPAATLVVYLPR